MPLNKRNQTKHSPKLQDWNLTIRYSFVSYLEYFENPFSFLHRLCLFRLTLSQNFYSQLWPPKTLCNFNLFHTSDLLQDINQLQASGVGI